MGEWGGYRCYRVTILKRPPEMWGMHDNNLCSAVYHGRYPKEELAGMCQSLLWEVVSRKGCMAPSSGTCAWAGASVAVGFVL